MQRMHRNRVTAPWGKKVQRRILDEGVVHGQQWRTIGGFFLLCASFLFVYYLIGFIVPSNKLEISSSFSDDATPEVVQENAAEKIERIEVVSASKIGEDAIAADDAVNEPPKGKVSEPQPAASATDDKKPVKPSESKPEDSLPDLGTNARDPEKENEALQKHVDQAPLVVFSKTWCPFCKKLKQVLTPFFDDKGTIKIFELDNNPDEELILNALLDVTGRRAVPKVFLAGEFIGGLNEIREMIKTGDLKTKLEVSKKKFAERSRHKEIPVV